MEAIKRGEPDGNEIKKMLKEREKELAGV